MSLRRGLEKRVMNRDNSNHTTFAFPVLSIFRGLYQRVAAKLGVDPSYVSRVARGERTSALVLAALQEEMDVIRHHLNQPSGELTNGKAKDGEPRDGKLQNGKLKDGVAPDGAFQGSTALKAALRDGKQLNGKAGTGKSGNGARRTSNTGSTERAAD